MRSHSLVVTEEHLSTLTVGAASGSALFMALFFIVALGLADLQSIKAGIASSPYFIAAILGLGAYVFSMYLVETAPGSSYRRKLASWSLSAMLHVSVFTGCAIAFSSLQLALALLLPEAVVGLLSLTGLVFVIRQARQRQRAN